MEEEIIPESPTPWECCGKIQCNCNQNISPISYPSDYPNEIQENSPEEDVNVIFTPAYIYPIPELIEIYEENIHIKSVVAYQPIQRGGSKCTFECDVENHHIHTYCSSCKKNLPYRTVIHECEIGINEEQIHPDMQNYFLINTL